MIYPDIESRHLEFKATLPTFMQLIKTCVAFANGVGGKIIIGIEDNTRKIIGVDENIRNSVYEDFPSSLYDSTEPNLMAEIYEKNFGQHNVIVIEIPNILKKPAYVKKEGFPKGIYLRAGSSTRRANEDYIEELKRDNKRITYDEETVHADIEILSEELIKKAYPTYTQAKLLAEKISGQKIVDKRPYMPTVAGVLWFCEKPDVFINAAHIRCTRFQDVSGRDIIQTEEIGGSLSDQIENSFSLIKSWLVRDLVLKSTKMSGKMIIPAEALREAIINAVVHRKYSIPGAIKIALYEDRLEIFNPGNFPGLVDINNLGDGTTYLRNPVIAKIARRLQYMEQLGTGINLIRASCKKSGLKGPVFIESSDSVKVVFNFIPDFKLHNTDEENLRGLFAMRDLVSINDVVDMFKISRNTATRRLNKLLVTGVLERFGKGPAVKYCLSGKRKS
jgi:ATP-dependent DNA helicase RecG